MNLRDKARLKKLASRIHSLDPSETTLLTEAEYKAIISAFPDMTEKATKKSRLWELRVFEVQDLPERIRQWLQDHPERSVLGGTMYPDGTVKEKK